jgi:hypothetical protein
MPHRAKGGRAGRTCSHGRRTPRSINLPTCGPLKRENGGTPTFSNANHDSNDDSTLTSMASPRLSNGHFGTRKPAQV